MGFFEDKPAKAKSKPAKTKNKVGGFVDAVKDAITGTFESGATFFDSPSSDSAQPAGKGQSKVDENGRKYTEDDATGDRTYSDGRLHANAASPTAPKYAERLSHRPFGRGAAKEPNAWSTGVMSTHIPSDAYLHQSRMTQAEFNHKRGIARRAQEWFENIVNAGAGRN